MASGRPTRRAIYDQYQRALADLRLHGGLPTPAKATSIWREVWFVEAHHSTALEGNTLVLKEVRQLLAEGKAVGAKPLADYLEVEGYAKAANWVYEQAYGPADLPHPHLLTVTEVRRIHELVMSDVWTVRPHPDSFDDEGPGQWRRHEHQPFPGGMVTVFPTDVPSQVSDWVDAVNALPQTLSPFPSTLAELHVAFERIHPFLDGYGRTGRLLLNLILVRSGHPPLTILKEDRERYLRALRKGDEGDYGPLGELLARGLIQAIHRFILPSMSGAHDLLPLSGLASKELSVTALTRAVERGRLRGVKTDSGRWQSTAAWLREYMDSRYRRTSADDLP